MLWMRNLKLIQEELTCPVFPSVTDLEMQSRPVWLHVSAVCQHCVSPSFLPASSSEEFPWAKSEKEEKSGKLFVIFLAVPMISPSFKLSWDQVTCFLSHPSFSHGWDEQGEAESSKGTLLMSPHHNHIHDHQPLQQSSALFASSRGSLLGDAGRKQHVKYPQLALPDAWFWTIPRLLGSGVFCSGYWYETSWAPFEWHSPSSCKPVW